MIRILKQGAVSTEIMSQLFASTAVESYHIILHTAMLGEIILAVASHTGKSTNSMISLIQETKRDNACKPLAFWVSELNF